jgi:CheY-like chemotaxis protein
LKCRNGLRGEVNRTHLGTGPLIFSTACDFHISPSRGIAAALLFIQARPLPKEYVSPNETMFLLSDWMCDLSVTMLTPHIPMDILLIEDRSEDIHMVEQAMTTNQLANRVIVAKNAIEATMYLRQCAAVGPLDEHHELNSPGLILLDVNMSEHRGLDILHDLRTDNKLMTIPIVILTNSLEETDLACTMSHGVTGYFLKPMDAAQLRKVVKDVEEHWSLLTTAPCAN